MKKKIIILITNRIFYNTLLEIIDHTEAFKRQSQNETVKINIAIYQDRKAARTFRQPNVVFKQYNHIDSLKLKESDVRLVNTVTIARLINTKLWSH